MREQESWKARVQHQIEPALASEIDAFEGQIALKRQGKISDKVFAETRLRRGVYGQRYDNGKRNDGKQVRDIPFPSAETNTTKGPDTHWDAPGMLRIKIPYGGLNPAQLETLADLADEYSDGILHVTTRQDIQYHYIHIDDTPDIMRRLGAVGITTQEACGNVTRNVTACPLAGVCRSQAFDVTPYADVTTQFLMGHPDGQDFGRKFKVAFSGCADEACGLVKMHDLGFLARTKMVDGQLRRGFTLFVGGGLGTVPHQAKVLYEFAAEDEILPISQAIMRIFARLGEKKNRNRARLKFLVSKLGIDEFKQLVEEELPTIPHDPAWSNWIDTVDDNPETPSKPALYLNGAVRPAGFDEWYETNVYAQRQENYATVTINLPLGDFTSQQSYQLADVAREYAGDNLRLTVEQNIVLRWISFADLPALYGKLSAIGLGDAGAGTIVDITTCPGTDTCKLGIAASRGLTGKLREQLAVKNSMLPQAIKNLRIKVSGCFNSCGQHHVADIGFFGNSRRKNNRTVPHFQVVLGGKWRENGGAYGLAVGAVPSKRVPDVLDAITDRYAKERERSETFQAWVTRLGKVEIKTMLKPFQQVETYEVDPNFYSDWGDPREYTIGDIGIGECAGEVISLFSFEISKAEGTHFDALIALEAGDFALAESRAYASMIEAARALVRNEFLDVGQDPDHIVAEFKSRFYDTQKFFDPYAKGKFGKYLLERFANPPITINEEVAHRIIEEAQLFIEAAHACDARLAAAAAQLAKEIG